jgi:pimeloyl-ACP methyl ester carboxylesterase
MLYLPTVSAAQGAAAFYPAGMACAELRAGFGLTDAGRSGDYRDGRKMALVSDLIDPLGVTRASLFGASPDGVIAWRIAAGDGANESDKTPRSKAESGA